IGGSERIIPIEQALEEVSSEPVPESVAPSGVLRLAGASESAPALGDFAKVCFYITPIGDEDSEQRRHADFLMEYIIKPAVAEFGLTVVRADQMGKPGMIGKQ